MPSETPAELVRPTLLNAVTVEYPSHLLADPSPPAGEVRVRFRIDTEGVPQDIAIEQGLHPDLDQIALDAVAQLRYTPATYQGNTVEVIDRIAIAFAPPAPADDPTPPEAPTVSPEPEPDDEPPPSVEDAGPIRMDGFIKQAGDRVPLPDATLIVVPAEADARIGEIKKTDYSEQRTPEWSVQVTSDAEGRFEVRGIPSGNVKVVVVAAGFERAEFIESIPEGEAISLKYFIQRLSSNPYRTVVESRSQREEVARRTITVEEINNLPGTQGDALKAVQNFPGIARSPFGAGLLAIRGTGPNDSAIYFGYHEIPILFHFGGLTSVFNSDILSRIDFIPGNFDARYGDATGGIVDVTPRAGRRDGFHGYIDADVFDAGILFEGPIGKGSFILSGRRSYIDALLPAVIPDDAGLGLTVAPRYYDYQALFDYPIGKHGVIKVRAFGSDDRTVLVASDPNEVDTDARDQFETSQYFHRADLVYEWSKGPWKFFITPSYQYNYLDLSFSDAFSLNIFTHNLNGRTELSRRLTKRASLNVGAELQSYWFTVDVTSLPIPNGNSPGSTSQRLSSNESSYTAIPSVYSTLSLGIGPNFTLYPGLRVSYYTKPYKFWTTDPRVRFGWQVGPQTTIKGGVGLYSQAPQPVDANDVYGNPNVIAERSVQTSLGVAHQFPYSINVEATAFFNYQWDRIYNSTELVLRNGQPVPENTANTQLARIYGLELLIRKDITRNVYGWLAYTLSRSERRDAPGEPYRLFNLDQTHVLTLVGVYKFPKGWQVGARFRVVTGNPDTPIIGSVYDAGSGGYLPIEGETNSERVPAFHQLDLRVDKKWTWKRLSWTLYLDVQNVYNAQNVEFWQYSYDFRARNEIPSLPIIPSLGTKLEF